MPERLLRSFLKDREAKALLAQASERLKANIEHLLKTEAHVEQVETEQTTIYLINGRPLLAKMGGNLLPTLTFTEYVATAPKAVVDMGAIPYVCKGASVMRPGVRRFEGEFQKGDLVAVVDEKYGKPLSIGETLYSRTESQEATRGAVIRNLHFVGDKLWASLKKLAT